MLREIATIACFIASCAATNIGSCFAPFVVVTDAWKNAWFISLKYDIAACKLSPNISTPRDLASAWNQTSQTAPESGWRATEYENIGHCSASSKLMSMFPLSGNSPGITFANTPKNAIRCGESNATATKWMNPSSRASTSSKSHFRNSSTNSPNTNSIVSMLSVVAHAPIAAEVHAPSSSSGRLRNWEIAARRFARKNAGSDDVSGPHGLAGGSPDIYSDQIRKETMETGGKPRRVARLAGDDGPGELVYPVDLFEEHVGQLVCAVEGGEVGKVVACLKEISRMLLMGATFGEDGMEFVYASPLMQVLVSCLERPEVECRREALLVMREVLGQSCEEIDSFVENGWVPMIVGRVQVGEDVICAGYCVNIMSRCVRNARFASEMRADRGWFEQMMGMSRAEDDSYVKLFAAFLPHLVEVDASLRDVIIEEGNRLLRKSIGEQREPDVWDEIQSNVLEAFYQVIVESEGFMMFVSRECLEMIFIIIKLIIHNDLIIITFI